VRFQKSFFRLQFGVFFVLGLFSFLGLYEKTPIQMIESGFTGRDPASVAATATLKSTEILTIDCANFNQEVSVPAHQVRLEGYLCDMHPEQKGISIWNQTTGKVATLFKPGRSRYMTDFIQLVSGKNKIKLSYLSKGNQPKEVELTIIK
jgi:hypothetical protein